MHDKTDKKNKQKIIETRSYNNSIIKKLFQNYLTFKTSSRFY